VVRVRRADRRRLQRWVRLPGGQTCWPGCVSADGSVVVGTSEWSDGGERATRWTRVGGVWQPENLGAISGDYDSGATGVSGDGSVVVGLGLYGEPNPTGERALRWTRVDGIVALDANPPGAQANCWAINSAGTMAAGMNDYAACIWTIHPDGGTDLLSLGVLPGDNFSTAGGIVADGSVVIGQSSNGNRGQGFRWTRQGGMESVGLLPGGVWSTAIALNGDGSVVVGYANLPESVSSPRAFRWRIGTGMAELPALPGWDDTYALAVSSDGAVVGGISAGNATSAATLWSPALGVVDLNVYLATLGIDLTGWTLQGVYGMTPDGLTLIGDAYHNGQAEGWIATIPVCGRADFDGDGMPGTDADIAAFFACLGGECCVMCGSADFDGNGDVGTDADIESYFRVLGGGSCL